MIQTNNDMNTEKTTLGEWGVRANSFSEALRDAIEKYGITPELVDSSLKNIDHNDGAIEVPILLSKEDHTYLYLIIDLDYFIDDVKKRAWEEGETLVDYWYTKELVVKEWINYKEELKEFFVDCLDLADVEI